MVKGFRVVNETEVEVFLEFFSILEQLGISRTFLLPVKYSHPFLHVNNSVTSSVPFSCPLLHPQTAITRSTSVNGSC